MIIFFYKKKRIKAISFLSSCALPWVVRVLPCTVAQARTCAGRLAALLLPDSSHYLLLLLLLLYGCLGLMAFHTMFQPFLLDPFIHF